MIDLYPDHNCSLFDCVDHPDSVVIPRRLAIGVKGKIKWKLLAFCQITERNSSFEKAFLQLSHVLGHYRKITMWCRNAITYNLLWRLALFKQNFWQNVCLSDCSWSDFRCLYLFQSKTSLPTKSVWKTSDKWAEQFPRQPAYCQTISDLKSKQLDP